MTEHPESDRHSFIFKWGETHISAKGWGIIAAIVAIVVLGFIASNFTGGF